MNNDRFRFYLNMKALAKHLEEMNALHEITNYEVIEHYACKPVKRFDFINLGAESDDCLGEETIIFFDAEETMHEVTSNDMYSTLVGFSESCVHSAYFSIPIEGRVEIRIIFDTGYVDIIAHSDYQLPDNEHDEDILNFLNMDDSEIDEIYREYYSEEHDYCY